MLKRRFFLYFLLVFLLAIFCSCSSVPLKVDKTEERYYLNKNCGTVYSVDNMEFLGFSSDKLSKNKNPDEDLLGDYDFWKRLERTNGIINFSRSIHDMGYAEFKSLNNFNDYSLYELDNYSSKSRYLSFIEVKDNFYMVDDNHISKNVKATIGTIANIAAIIEFAAAISTKDQYYRGYKIVDNSEVRKLFMGYGFGFLGVGTFFSLINLNPVKSKFTYNGEYEIYVYDKIERRVVLRKPVQIKFEDSFKGIIEATEADEDLLYEYFGQKIANALMKSYERLENKEEANFEQEIKNLCEDKEWKFEGVGKLERNENEKEFNLIGVGGQFENWESILYQYVKLEGGCKYNISFEAKTDLPRSIIMNVNSNEPSYIRFLQDKNLTLGEDYTAYSFDFKVFRDTSKAKVEFLLGQGKRSNVSIKNILIQKIN